jgi:dienelactone hydrolase
MSLERGNVEELMLGEQDEKQLPESRLKIAWRWMRSRYKLRLSRDNRLTYYATGSMAFLGTAAMSLAAKGMPTGLGTWLDQLLFLAANGIGMIAAAILLPILLALAYIPLPRRLLSMVLYVGVEGYCILYYSDLELVPSLIFGSAFSLMGVLLGLALGWLRLSGFRLSGKLFAGMFAAAILGCVQLLPGFPWPIELPRLTTAGDELSGTIDGAESVILPSSKTTLANPSLPGTYEVLKFSYGSGTDKHREVFGDKTDIRSEDVDASSYITVWPKLKTAFWGFDEASLPLNGRVWMPQGDGPFPLVLMVHGNHLMEYFSDGGYEYLGELLASRGMIAVSVDANFFNFSVWSSLPNDDMKMRAWLMLQHLSYLKDLDKQEKGILADRIDWNSVALIGHSRGGQAVAMAADAKRWFAEDDVLQKLEDVNIKSVVAIAPTDKGIDDESAHLTDVNYLTIQGARDGDVNNFYGDRQYNRISFSDNEGLFKAGLYLSNANHSQFNTDWGRMDERLPGGLFLNSEGLMAGEDQRQVAKVFISAFLEATLFGRSEYQALFQDYRIGRDWLPRSTRYMNRYESSGTLIIEDFESSSPIIRGTMMEGLEASEESVKDRDGNGRGTTGLLMEWSEPEASYTFEFRPNSAAKLHDYADGSLMFSLANSEWQLSRDQKLPPLPKLELEARDREGKVWTMRLEERIPVQPPFYTSFMVFGPLERTVKDNKYKESAEAVFQSFIIPLNQFKAEDESGKLILPEQLDSLTFKLMTDSGRIMIDDIGLMKQGGTYVEYQSTP